MRTSLWPTGLIGRVSIVLFAAIVLELLGSTFFFEQAEVLSSDDAQTKRIAEQLETAARVLDLASAGQRPAVAKTLSEPGLQLEWRSAPTTTMPDAVNERSKSLATRITAAEPGLSERQLALHSDTVGPNQAVTGRLRLKDGSALEFRAMVLGSSLSALYGQLGSIIVLSCCVLLAALLIVRTLAAPLRMLVQATDAIGHGPPIHLDEHGPREIRRVATAFNAMQERISKLLKDRTEALAAVSHDLRTPIGRMKLRAGFLASSEDQAAFDADLGEMEAMLNDLLAYLGGETDPEKPKPTDVAVMLQTLADTATDAGEDARYDGPDHLTLTVRSLALKRAFSNLVNNAIAYGKCVHIDLAPSTADITILFEDAGPGIPEMELAAVFEPFFRGDSSRNRATGGMGLGLSITRQAIWREGGTIDLQNRTEGGLRVKVVLPRS